MNKCSECNEPYEATKKARHKCSGSLCQAWIHKQCSDKRDFSKDGYWYCKIHITDIPLEQRRSNIRDDEDSSDKDVDDNGEIKNKINDDNKSDSSDVDEGKTLEDAIPEQSNDHFSSLVHVPSDISHVTKRNKKGELFPMMMEMITILSQILIVVNVMKSSLKNFKVLYAHYVEALII